MKKIVLTASASFLLLLAVFGSPFGVSVALEPRVNLGHWAVIEDVNGDRIGVQTFSDEVWSLLVQLYHNGSQRWIGGIVETYENEWGFRFDPNTIMVAEVTIEVIQSTIRFISENLGYWLGGMAVVGARVIEINLIRVPQDIMTIQEAVNNASDGDTIFVSSGVYYENVVVNKTVSLIGENRGTTIIDGNGIVTPIFQITANNVTIRGFTIQNGGRIFGWEGGGIYITDSNRNNIVDNTITNTQYGINLRGSARNIIVSNNITANDVGIQFLDDYSSNSTIYHNNFINNGWQVSKFAASNNTWDDGYPSGGNYWSDHNPPDLYSGPYQDETGRDGIGDMPYVIDENDTDRYPLIYPYGYVADSDLNDDGIVDIYDAIMLASAFGSEPGQPRWNPIADIYQDGIIDIYDIIMFASSFAPIQSGYLYGSVVSSPGKVLKIDLTTFTLEDTLILSVNQPAHALFLTNDNLFVGTRGSPATILQIRLSDFREIDKITLPTGFGNVIGLETDGTYLYASLVTGQVVKLTISPLAIVDWLTTYNNGGARGIQYYNGYLYVTSFAGFDVPAYLEKFDAATLSFVDKIQLSFRRAHFGLLVGNMYYVASNGVEGEGGSTAGVMEINLDEFREVRNRAFDTGDRKGAADDAIKYGEYLFLNGDVYPLGRVYRVRISDFSSWSYIEVTGPRLSAPAGLGNYGYFPSVNQLAQPPGPAQIFKVNLDTFEQEDVLTFEGEPGIPQVVVSALSTISVDSPTSKAEVDQTFTINVSIPDVANLYGWEFKPTWTSTLLDVTNVTEGPFLKQSGKTSFMFETYNAEDYIPVNCTRSGYVSALSDNGIIATVEFYVEVGGESILDLYDTMLTSSQEQRAQR